MRKQANFREIYKLYNEKENEFDSSISSSLKNKHHLLALNFSLWFLYKNNVKINHKKYINSYVDKYINQKKVKTYFGEPILTKLMVNRIIKKVKILKNKKVILFDLDGTLINTLGDLNASVNYAISKYNYPLRTLTQTKNDIGNGVAKLIARSIPDNENNPNYQVILQDFRNHYSNNYNNLTKPYDDMLEVVTELKNRGYRLGVVTNKFQEGADKLINALYPNIFEVVQGEVPHLKNKPHPSMVDEALKNMGVTNKKEVIYIGDTNVDLQTAINANITPILVTYGYRNKEDLLMLDGYHLLVDTPIDLLYLLK